MFSSFKRGFVKENNEDPNKIKQEIQQLLQYITTSIQESYNIVTSSQQEIILSYLCDLKEFFDNQCKIINKKVEDYVALQRKTLEQEIKQKKVQKEDQDDVIMVKRQQIKNREKKQNSLEDEFIQQNYYQSKDLDQMYMPKKIKTNKEPVKEYNDFSMNNFEQEGNQFRCRICQKITNNRGNSQMHWFYMHSKTAVSCLECSNKCENFTKLYFHNMMIHEAFFEGYKIVQCQFCDKEYHQKQPFVQHLTQQHLEELEPMIGDFKKKYQIKYNKEQKALKFYF